MRIPHDSIGVAHETVKPKYSYLLTFDPFGFSGLRGVKVYKCVTAKRSMNNKIVTYVLDITLNNSTIPMIKRLRRGHTFTAKSVKTPYDSIGVARKSSTHLSVMSHV